MGYSMFISWPTNSMSINSTNTITTTKVNTKTFKNYVLIYEFVQCFLIKSFSYFYNATQNVHQNHSRSLKKQLKSLIPSQPLPPLLLLLQPSPLRTLLVLPEQNCAAWSSPPVTTTASAASSTRTSRWKRSTASPLARRRNWPDSKMEIASFPSTAPASLVRLTRT